MTKMSNKHQSSRAHIPLYVAQTTNLITSRSYVRSYCVCSRAIQYYFLLELLFFFLLEFYKNPYLYIFRGRKILKTRRSIYPRGKYVEFELFSTTHVFSILFYFIIFSGCGNIICLFRESNPCGIGKLMVV